MALRLQPIFVKRISALEHANDQEAEPLLKGLSMGPFDQKWGALTVALWLAQEAKGDDHNLQKWVEAGPMGVLKFAQKISFRRFKRRNAKAMNSKPQMKSSAYERIAQQKEIEKKKLIKSADLYAEIYDKDKGLRKLTESAIAEWPE